MAKEVSDILFSFLDVTVSQYIVCFTNCFKTITFGVDHAFFMIYAF